MLNRRQLATTLAGIGIGSTTFQRALAAQSPAQTAPVAGAITAEMIQQAEWVAGITLTDAERKRLATALQRQNTALRKLREEVIDNSIAPALVFHPAQAHTGQRELGSISMLWPSYVTRPSNDLDLAFSSVVQLSHLLRTRQISSVELTKLYLARLKKHDPTLLCVVSLTEDLALKQAAQADAEIVRGGYRGPLHGIPWGAKDLIAYPGYKTTWGAGPYKEQTLNTKATVARKLEEAGAVMCAKLTLGALAMGDGWYGGMTRNPWNPKQGSSGSSAGSASATSAGLVGFTIGTETLGSIVSPSTRCGVTGLRPTFGRVSRAGCMALAWSMDKVGPIARTVEDCAYIFAAIQGVDPLDNSTVDRGFTWPSSKPVQQMKVGYVESTTKKKEEREELQLLEQLGITLVPVKLPLQKAVSIVSTILTAEAGASFDHLTRQGIKEGIGTWPATFQEAQFISAVEYLRANRIRSQLMQEMEEIMTNLDAIVAGGDLVLTNLTGHPQVVMPFGFSTFSNNTQSPKSITFTGKLYGESELLTLCHQFQIKTDYHLKRPPID
jgi:Asp-tRNA(Asn)/Glu-tRNA(Gln) amidotransferase A subunit family amidase